MPYLCTGFCDFNIKNSKAYELWSLNEVYLWTETRTGRYWKVKFRLRWRMKILTGLQEPTYRKRWIGIKPAWFISTRAAKSIMQCMYVKKYAVNAKGVLDCWRLSKDYSSITIWEMYILYSGKSELTTIDSVWLEIY